MNILLSTFIGCNQLEEVGAKSEIEAISDITPEQAQTCSQQSSEILFGNKKIVPPKEGLSGEPLTYSEDRDVFVIFAMDHSGSMNDTYPKYLGEKSTYYWERPEWRTFLENTVFSDKKSTNYYPLLFNDGMTFLQNEQSYYYGVNDEGIVDSELAANLQPYSYSDAVNALTSVDGGTLEGRPWDFYKAKIPEASKFRPWNNTRIKSVLSTSEKFFESKGAEDGILWLVTDNIADVGISSKKTINYKYNGVDKGLTNVMEIQKNFQKNPKGDHQVQDGDVWVDVKESSVWEDVNGETHLNDDFYQELHKNNRWQIVRAYPINEGDWLNDRALIAYSLYYSKRSSVTESTYETWTNNDTSPLGKERLRKGFSSYSHPTSPVPGGALRLKPNDLDILQLEIVGAIKCKLAREGKPRKCQIKFRLSNLLEHRRITKGSLSFSASSLIPFQYIPKKKNTPVFYQSSPLEPNRFFTAEMRDEYLSTKNKEEYNYRPFTWNLTKAIEPLEQYEETIEVYLPPITDKLVTFQDYWVSAQNKNIVHRGSVVLRINDLQTEAVVNIDSMKEVYGVSSLPTIFQDFSTENMETSRCLSVYTKNQSQFIALLGLAGGAVLVGLALFVAYLLKSTYREVRINGVPQGALNRVKVRRVLRSRVKSDGIDLGAVSFPLFGKVIRFHSSNKYKTKVAGKTWEVTINDRRYVVELVPPGSRKRR